MGPGPAAAALPRFNDCHGHPQGDACLQRVAALLAGGCSGRPTDVVARCGGEEFTRVNAFSRCENGKTKPPLALVKLLKVLDRHPDLLDEVRAS